MTPRAGRRSGRRIATQWPEPEEIPSESEEEKSCGYLGQGVRLGVLTLDPVSTVLAADQTVELGGVLPLDLYPWIAYPPAGDFHPAPSLRRTV